MQIYHKDLSVGVKYFLQCNSGFTRLTRNVKVMGSNPIKCPRCFLEQETLPLLISTGWFQERIRAWYHNRTKIIWVPYGRL